MALLLCGFRLPLDALPKGLAKTEKAGMDFFNIPDILNLLKN